MQNIPSYLKSNMALVLQCPPIIGVLRLGVPQCPPINVLLQKNLILFLTESYKQITGVAMGSPLGPTLANAFLVHFEKNWLQNHPSDFKHHYYRRYVNDIFVLFISPKHLEAFRNLLNSRHANMSFTIEREKQNRMSFLDIAIISKDKTFANSVYPKLTFSGVYIHFDSFLLSTYKFGTCK